MPKRSAGLLLYRLKNHPLEVFLVHPGGPFWVKKDLGAWSIPKGEYLDGEDPLTVAKREFEEETGLAVDGTFRDLGEQKQSGGKIISIWAIERDCDPSALRSNTFQIEWPPRSGRMAEFPEVDRWEWLPLPEAMQRIVTGQRIFLERLLQTL
jgi:predicted NUDIX family NTP pyrophosphohydrolase